MLKDLILHTRLMFVSCTQMKICRTRNVVRVDWSRSPQLHTLRAGKKGHKAASVVLYGSLCVTGLPLISLPP